MADQNAAEETRAPRPVRIELLLFVVIVLACSQLGYVGHPRYGPFVAAADVACAALFLGWVLKVWREKRAGRLQWPPAPVWALLAVGTASIAKSAMDMDGGLSVAGIKSGVIEIAQIALYFAAGYMMFVDILNSVAKVRRACTVLLGATTVVVAWGLVDYVIRPDALDVSAGFGNRNVHSAFLLMVLPLLLGIAMHERDRRMRGWALAVIGLGMITMLGPPHVWILAGILCWLAYLRGDLFRKFLVPGIIGLTVVICVALPRNHAANVGELLDIYEREDLHKLQSASEGDEWVGDESGGGDPAAESPPVKKRWLEWQPALAMMTENIALGVGAGSFQSNIGRAEYYGTLPNYKKGEPDTNNLYLVIGATMGLLGLVSLIALLAKFWRDADALWLRAGSSVERGLAAGLPGAIIGIALANIFSSLFVRGTGLIWALIFAMITAVSREGIAAMRREAARRAGE